MTLPPGKDRDETLSHIYHAWPDNDEATKEAFLKLHGLKQPTLECGNSLPL